MNAGRVLEITEKQYEEDKFFDDFPTLRSSILWKLVERGGTPRAAWWSSPRLNPNYQADFSRKFDLGRACHCLLLGRGAEFVIIDADDFRTKEAKALRESAYLAGKTPLLKAEFEQAKAMRESAIEQLKELVSAGTLERMPFGEGETERVLLWNDNGVWCRCRVDHAPHDGEGLNEYKTTSASAHPDLFAFRQVRQLGYDVQLGFYRRGLEACGIATSPNIGIFAQETFEPYLLSYMRLDDELIMRANMRIDAGLRTWKRCLETKVWPGYSAHGYDIELTERERAENERQFIYNGKDDVHVESSDIAAGLDKPSMLVKR